MKNSRTAAPTFFASACAAVMYGFHVVLPELLTVGKAAAQTDYPTRPVRLLVGFGPGTSPDIVARLLGDRLFQAWGKPVVIENAIGASGNIAGERVVRAEPDGHTLLLTGSVITISPHL